MKPEALELIQINPVRVNDFVITKLEVDMRHINYGLDRAKNYNKFQRSNFHVSDVKKAFMKLDNKILAPHFNEMSGYYYFAYEGYLLEEKKIYRIVFCINKDSDASAGVITLFELGENYDISK